MDALAPEMLLLADRGFFSFALWKKAKATGAGLLWRTKSSHVLDIHRRLSVGFLPVHELSEYQGSTPRHQWRESAGH
jgi:hypothetical protein